MLHCTRDEFDARVTADEYRRLIAFHELKSEREQKAMEKAKRDAELAAKRGKRRR